MVRRRAPRRIAGALDSAARPVVARASRAARPGALVGAALVGAALVGASSLGLVTVFASGHAQAGSVDDVAPAPPTTSGASEIDVTDTGRLRKELGEPAGLVLAGVDVPAFEITVEAVTVLERCRGRGMSVAPERGHFVVVDLTALMPDDPFAGSEGALPAAGPSPAADLFMPLVADAFTVIGPDGRAQAAPTEASWACFEDAVLAPPFVGAGESASGKVVLDSAVSTGALVYAPAGSAGWEWAF